MEKQGYIKYDDHGCGKVTKSSERSDKADDK